MTVPRLILGSTSPYRKALLEKLGITFTQMNPSADETPEPGEAPRKLALRLGREKARSIAAQLKDEQNWLIIASDQVCHTQGALYGKPGTPERAAEQLALFSGQWVTFSTSLALVSSTGQTFEAVEDYSCRFRDLTRANIEHYIQLDQPLDCAGSIKVEQAGVVLLSDSAGRDINTLYGLPLMLLCEALQSFSHNVFDFNAID